MKCSLCDTPDMLVVTREGARRIIRECGERIQELAAGDEQMQTNATTSADGLRGQQQEEDAMVFEEETGIQKSQDAAPPEDGYKLQEQAVAEPERAEWIVFCALDSKDGRLYPAYSRIGGDAAVWVRPDGMTEEYAKERYDEALVQWSIEHPEEAEVVMKRGPSRDFNYGR